MSPGSRVAVAVIMAVLALAGADRPRAETYPSRPVTLVVPFAAGGGTDAVARFVADALGRALGGRVVIENRAGANGAPAATFVARAAPDGYTLFMTTNTTHSVNPALMKEIGYDPVKDFAPVAQMGNHPFMLVIGRHLAAKSLGDLIAYAKANPGKLTYGYGNGTGLVAAETFKRMAGIDVLKVPYRSTPQALTDMVGGRLDMMFIDVTAGIGQVQAGAVQAIGIANREGTATLPDVPPVASVLPGFDLVAWNGVFAPARTSPEIVARLNAELRRILEPEENRRRLAAIGLDVRTGSPDDLGRLVTSELTVWSNLVREAGIELE